MLYGIVLLIHVFVCFVLIAVILLQAGRGGGVAETFGGGAAQSILGTRGAAFLTRATSACATIFMLTSITLAILSAQRGRSLMEGVRLPPEASAPAKEPASSPSP